MPTYKYTATNIRGKKEYGMMEALSGVELNEKLKAEGLFLLEFKEYKEKNKRPKYTAEELTDFCRQLGSMLDAGVDLVRALQIIAQRDMKKHLRETYASINMLLRQGMPLSDAMEEQEGVFPELLINMIRAAEASGTLGVTVINMANHYEKEQKLKTKIRGATTYPVILLSLTILASLVIFIFVMPKFSALFEGFPMPLPTRIILSFSTMLRDNVFALFIAIAFIILVIAIAWRFRSVQVWFDKMKLRAPVIGGLLKIIHTARFARTLSSLYSSGIPMVRSLAITKGTITNRHIASQIDNMIDKVKNGDPLSRAIDYVDGFDTKLASTVMVGEETGRLRNMLESTADSMEYEAENAMQRLTTFIEPAMVIFLAVIIGFVVLAVMMPMASLYNNIGMGV